jgi:hypothetical protein
MRTLSILLLIIAAMQPALAQIVRFQPVPGKDAYPRGVALSSRYRVLVKSAGDQEPWAPARHATATYRLWPDYLDPETLPAKHKDTAVHVAQIDSEARVRVRVELIDGSSIERLALKPSRLSEMSASETHGSNWVEFEIDPYRVTRTVLVEINAPERDTDALHEGLLFFLNPLSTMPAGNVLVLPSGVIDEQSPHLDDLNRLLIDANSPYDALYIPHDTLIDGRVDIRKAGFVVAGRGMIVGSRWPFVKAVPGWRERYPDWISPDGEWVRPLLSYIHPHETEDTTSRFEGVLVAHPYHFCVGWAHWNENLKTFGWRFSSDGIHGTHKRGSFMRVNDDATYVDQGTIEDCVYWGMVNGAVFQLGWGLNRDNDRPVTVRRVDVVRGEWENMREPGIDRIGAPVDAPAADFNTISANRGVFAGTYRSGRAFTVRNKHFEDVRVDAQVNRLFYFGSRTEEVSYENFVLKDIWFAKEPSYEHVKNVLRSKRPLRGFVFENVVVGDRKIENLGDLKPLDQRNIEAIEFR